MKKISPKLVIICEIIIFSCLILFLFLSLTVNTSNQTQSDSKNKDYIKWVDFKITKAALSDACTYDVESHDTELPLNWIELLSYLGAKNGGDFKDYKSSQMDDLVNSLKEGETMEALTKDLKYYDYYLQAYSAVLGGMVGEYEAEEPSETEPGEKQWVKKYGLKAFHPIAKGFPYQSYDDFGASRSYGYKRPHLGHDLMGQVGTPIVAVEDGYVEALGWNQYGGWRIGIRSFDKKRYYYYAHLRKDFPYCRTLKEGDEVKAGDVIGYMGRTGYSTTQNVNNITASHLHFGIQLIFDESQKEGNNEIWIDCYQLVQFLCRHQSETARDDKTKEWIRVYQTK